MTALTTKAFLKDLLKIPTKARTRIEALVFQDWEDIDTLTDIPNVKKLSGYRDYYRIRVGSYRVGITYEGDVLTFVRVAKRGKIYNVFP